MIIKLDIVAGPFQFHFNAPETTPGRFKWAIRDHTDNRSTAFRPWKLWTLRVGPLFVQLIRRFD